MSEEKVLINYDKNLVYKNDPTNQIGTDTDLLSLYPSQSILRTIPTPAGDIAYVRKFGTAHTITDLTNLSDPGVANLTWVVKTTDGITTYGSRANGGAYTDGSTTAISTAIRLEAVASGGNVTLPASMTLTDATFGALTVILPAETVYNGDTRIFYISAGGSSYYDLLMKYGGARHTPILNSNRYSYFHIYDAHAACVTANDDGVEILDSETYSFPYKDSGGTWRYELDMNKSGLHLYSASGYSPKIKSIVGADTDREVSGLFNNATAVFFNENGTNVDTGATGYQDTWHDPYGTIANALTAAAAKGITNVIYGGINGANGTITENLNITVNNYNFETEYGYIPYINGYFYISHTTGFVAANIIGFGIKEIHILAPSVFPATTMEASIYCCNIYNSSQYGIRLFGGYEVPNSSQSTAQAYVKNCKIYNSVAGITTSTSYPAVDKSGAVAVYIDNSYIYNNYYGIDIFSSTAQCNLYINNSLIYNNTYNIRLKTSIINTNMMSTGYDIRLNNCFLGISEYTIFCNGLKPVGSQLSVIIDNNIIYLNDIGIEDNGNTLGVGTADNNCFWENTIDTSGGGFVYTNSITIDPILNKETLSYKFGISRNSSCYRSGNDNDDVGSHLRIIEINNDDIEINGIQIDGNSQYNNAIYILDSVDHTGVIIKWCSIFDFQGIAIDLYDDDTNTDAIISNNLIYNSGNGIALSYGGNTIEYNVVYNNSIFGIWSDYTGNIFNHNVFYGNEYGLYLESNSAAITIKNCIFNNNSFYGIFSEVSIIVTYCDITDAVNNIYISDSTNITDNPLFVNTNAGEENFNIKTIEAGFIKDSACKNAGESDIGAYQLDRGIESEAWKTYQLEHNPENMNDDLIPKGLREFESGTGSIDFFAKCFKRIFPFIWTKSNPTTKEQNKRLQYLNTLIKTRENELNNERTKVRLHFRPTEFLYSWNGIISGISLIDSLASWFHNEFKGYSTGIKFTDGIGTGTLSASAKTLTINPSPLFTTDKWKGYYIYYNFYYYIIVSNTANVLTLADPEGTLTDALNIDWAIEKYFKIISNTETILTLKDSNTELIDGTYDYYIDFIECKVNRPGFNFDQNPRFAFTKERQKSGYAITFEEI